MPWRKGASAHNVREMPHEKYYLQTMFTPLLLMVALSIALPERGLPAELPTIEKASLRREYTKKEFADWDRYVYFFRFDFVNDLAQPIEIISVNVFDMNRQSVDQDWGMSSPNFDPRLMTHELTGSHPLVKTFSQPGRPTHLEQATVSSVGEGIEIKVTNRILSAGQGIRPSGYLLSSKNKYNSLILRIAYKVNGRLREVVYG